MALRVADCEASARFYASAFGLTEIRRIGDGPDLRAIWLRAGDAVIMLERSLRGRGVDSGTGHVLVFATESLEAAERRLADAGIPVDDRTAFTLYVRDPDGHRAGVSVYAFEP